MSDVKQVIVVRKDLNMRKGKIAAQAAHASMAVILNMMDCECNELYETRTLRLANDSPVSQWLNESFTKICVSADSEEELLEVLRQAQQLGIPAALITDNGLTEFNGVKTNTCVAIGPWDSEVVDEVTGGLKLL